MSSTDELEQCQSTYLAVQLKPKLPKAADVAVQTHDSPVSCAEPALAAVALCPAYTIQDSPRFVLRAALLRLRRPSALDVRAATLAFGRRPSRVSSATSPAASSVAACVLLVVRPRPAFVVRRPSPAAFAWMTW